MLLKKPAALLKRPVAAPAIGGKKVFATPAMKCHECGCALKKKGHDVDATLFSLDGCEEVAHMTYQCCSRTCRTNYGYNYRWVEKKKLNTCRLEDVDDVLFVNSKVVFSVKYLRYHDALQFRGFVSGKAIVFAGREVLFCEEEHATHTLDYLYQRARFLLLAMQELPLVPGCGDELLYNIDLENAISSVALTLYDSYLHEHEYPPADRHSVREIVCDGHEKVKERIYSCNEPGKRAGRPRKSGAKIPFTNGWFMAVDPKSRHILSVEQMAKPEDNAVFITAVEKVSHSYENANALIYDRMCKSAKAISTRPLLKQFKYLSVDPWHAKKHGATCSCNPNHVRRLKDRVRGLKVNGSVCEQIFSWFRGYANTFNSMKSNHHRFCVLYYCKRHNALVDSGDLSHLSDFARHRSTKPVFKRPASSYGCGPAKKRPAARS